MYSVSAAFLPYVHQKHCPTHQQASRAETLTVDSVWFSRVAFISVQCLNERLASHTCMSRICIVRAFWTNLGWAARSGFVQS